MASTGSLQYAFYCKTNQNISGIDQINLCTEQNELIVADVLDKSIDRLQKIYKQKVEGVADCYNGNPLKTIAETNYESYKQKKISAEEYNNFINQVNESNFSSEMLYTEDKPFSKYCCFVYSGEWRRQGTVKIYSIKKIQKEEEINGEKKLVDDYIAIKMSWTPDTRERGSFNDSGGRFRFAEWLSPINIRNEYNYTKGDKEGSSYVTLISNVKYTSEKIGENEPTEQWGYTGTDQDNKPKIFKLPLDWAGKWIGYYEWNTDEAAFSFPLFIDNLNKKNITLNDQKEYEKITGETYQNLIDFVNNYKLPWTLYDSSVGETCCNYYIGLYCDQSPSSFAENVHSCNGHEYMCKSDQGTCGEGYYYYNRSGCGYSQSTCSEGY